MKLSSLLEKCSIKPSADMVDKTYDPEIPAIVSDSNRVEQGSLFIAVKGFRTDGHKYISQAFANGAAAVIAEERPDDIKKENPIILVEDSRLAMAGIAAEFYGNPSKDMILAGITGTNGKTTTTWLIESIFKTSGFSTGVIGTVNIRYNGKVYDNPVTTPDSIDLQKWLYTMKKAGVSHVIMEVSSHGLELKRVDHCHFNLGVFTNLSQDHLDFHKDMNEYFNCKKRLFTQLIKPDRIDNAAAVLNIDDRRGKSLFHTIDYKTIGISTESEADLSAENIKHDIHGVSGTLCMPGGSFNFSSPLTGRFNLENILCAAGAAAALDIKPEQIKKGIEQCRTIPGRLEKIDNSIDRFLFVDYAHTPDALDSILNTLKQIAPKKIITLFGCGGDRDTSKRALMGKIACKQSDITIITSDNPRTENPVSIIEDISKGLKNYHEISEQELLSDPFQKGYTVEPDRKKAIKKAISISKPGDIVVVAGKGHETYQITNRGTIHFNDKEELEHAAASFADQFKPIEWLLDDLTAALDCEPLFSAEKKNVRFASISTDSRTIRNNQLFLALKGENFDGHKFIKALINKGVKGFITQAGFTDTLDPGTREILQKNRLVVFETSNTLTALGKLARYQRIRSNVKLVAITGSSGKTTTRQITEEIFKTHFHTLATKGNFNNEIGLPATLLNLSHAHEWAVVEMGMNHAGEISRLTRIALPDIAIITNTAAVHLEGVGSVNNVAKAKAEIFEGLNENSTAVIPGSDPRRKILEKGAEKNSNIKQYLFFGSDKNSDITASDIKNEMNSTRFQIEMEDEKHLFTIHSPALFMVENSLAAICAAKAAKISINGMKSGIGAFLPVSGRMNIYKLNSSVNIIDDTYNANPASVTAALKTLKSMSRDKNSIAVLGDMLELGEESDTLHRDIGRKAALLGINKLFIFGPQGKHIIKGAVENNLPAEDIFHGNKKKIAQKVLENCEPGTWVLIKGSRGMAMENVIEELKQMAKVTADKKMT